MTAGSCTRKGASTKLAITTSLRDDLSCIFVVFQLWYLLMVILVGTKNRGIGGYKDFLPSLPVPPLEKTAKR